MGSRRRHGKGDRNVEHLGIRASGERRGMQQGKDRQGTVATVEVSRQEEKWVS